MIDSKVIDVVISIVGLVVTAIAVGIAIGKDNRHLSCFSDVATIV